MITNRPKQSADMRELLRHAQDESLSPDRAREAGAALADASMRAGTIYDVPLAELTTEAYLGFDARVALVQAKAGIVRP